MSSQVEEKSISKKTDPEGTAGARAGASLGLDLAVGDREAGADGNKDQHG